LPETLIGAVFGKPDFGAPDVHDPPQPFPLRRFINVMISFLSIAAAVFFLVVRPVNLLMARRKTAPEVESVTKQCPECLSAIPAGARRCAFCTSAQP
jgi:large conductance mechanosensitive channel